MDHLQCKTWGTGWSGGQERDEESHDIILSCSVRRALAGLPGYVSCNSPYFISAKVSSLGAQRFLGAFWQWGPLFLPTTNASTNT